MYFGARALLWAVLVGGALVRADHPEPSPSPTPLPSASPTLPCPYITNSSVLKSFVGDWLENGNTTGCPGVQISAWDTSRVTDMSSVFEGAASFNEPLTSWTTAGVTTMESMFDGASSFNQSLDHFDTSSVVNMHHMFHDAENFNQDLASWDTSSVTQMRGMFAGATAFNGDISLWDVRNVEDKAYFLYNATSFTGDLSRWQLNSATEYTDAFNHTSIEHHCHMHPPAIYSTCSHTSNNFTDSGGDGCEWYDDNTGFCGQYDTENFTASTMCCACNGGYTTTSCAPCPDLTNANFQTHVNYWVANSTTDGCDFKHVRFWDTGKVTEMNGTFQSGSFNDDISLWDVSQVVTMDSMFYSNSDFNQDLSKWDVGSVTKMHSIFEGASFNGDISNWDMSNVWDAGEMFSGNTEFNSDIGGWEVSKVSEFGSMFYDATAFNQNISGWNVSSGIWFGDMFNGALSFNQDLSGWNATYASTNPGIDDNSEFGTTLMNTNMSCRNLILFDYTHDVNVTTDFNEELISACNATTPCVNVMENWPPDTGTSDGPPTDINVAFAAYLKYGTSAGYCNVTNWNTDDVTVFELMFVMPYFNGGYPPRTGSDTFNEPIRWNTSAATSMAHMFMSASSFDQPVQFDTASVTDMREMFLVASSFDQPVHFDTSSLITMNSMFFKATAFNSVANFTDLSSVTDMSDMFHHASAFDQDISSWNVSGVSNFGDMFVDTGLACDNLFKIQSAWDHYESWYTGGESKSGLADLANVSCSVGPCLFNMHNGEGRLDIHEAATFFLKHEMITRPSFDTTTCGNATQRQEHPCLMGWTPPPLSPPTVSPTASPTQPTDIPENCTKELVIELFEEYHVNKWPFGYLAKNIGDSFMPDDNYSNFAEAYAVLNVTGFLEHLPLPPDFKAELTAQFTEFYDAPLNETYNLEYGAYFCSLVGDERVYKKYVQPHMSSEVTFDDNHFKYCPIQQWETGSVTDMSSLFHSPNKLHQLLPGVNLSGWDTANVTTMASMFKGAVYFDGDIGGWETGSVTDTSFMFSGAESFNQPLPWDTQNVEDMSRMFSGATEFDQSLDWNTGKVRTMKGLFGFNTHTRFKVLPPHAAKNVKFFHGAEAFRGNISGWNTQNVTDFSYMFSGAKVYDGNVSSWDTSSAVTFKAMFGSDMVLDADDGPHYDCKELGFGYCGGALRFSGGDLTSWDTSSVQDTSFMFYCPGAVFGRKPAFGGNIYNWNTGSVKNTSYMFMFQHVFDSAIGNWDTSENEDARYMFAFASNFNTPLHWSTPKLQNTEGMFYGAKIFNSTLNFSTVSNVTSMKAMFGRTGHFNQDISGFDMRNVVDTSQMFAYSLFNQPLNSWNTSSVQDMSEMFAGSRFNQPLGSWNTSAVQDMSEMFAGSKFNQPLEAWAHNLGNVIDVTGMFECNENYSHSLEAWGHSIRPRYIEDMFTCEETQDTHGIRTNPRVSGWDFTNVRDTLPLELFKDFLGTALKDQLDCDENANFKDAKSHHHNHKHVFSEVDTCAPTRFPTLSPTRSPTNSPSVSPTTLNQGTEFIIQRDEAEAEKEIVQITGIFFGLCFALVLVVALLGVVYRRYKVGRMDMTLRGKDLRELLREQKRRLLSQNQAPPAYTPRQTAKQAPRKAAKFMY